MKRWHIWLILVAIGLGVGMYVVSNSTVESGSNIIDLPQAAALQSSPFGDSAQALRVGAIEHVSAKELDGKMIERMIYDPDSDSLWMADLTGPTDKSIINFDIETGTVTEYDNPSNKRTGNRWSGDFAVSEDGGVWLAFGSTILYLAPGTQEFVEFPVPEPRLNDKDLVAGVIDIAPATTGVYIARHGMKMIDQLQVDKTKPMPTIDVFPITLFSPDSTLSAQRIETLPDGSLLVLSGESQLEITEIAVYDNDEGLHAQRTGSFLPFFAVLSADRIAVLSSGDNAPTLVDLTNPDAPPLKQFPSVKAQSSEGMVYGGLAADTERGLAWFFTTEMTGDPRADLVKLDQIEAYFVRTSLGEDAVDRYQFKLIEVTPPIPSGPGPNINDPVRTIPDPSEMSVVAIPQFYPMSVDKRGDLWAWIDSSGRGYQSALIRVNAEATSERK